MIIACPCKHTEQDNLYGQEKRVANIVTGGKVPGSRSFLVARCTVCAFDHTLNEPAGRTLKTGGGSGKTRYWFESADHVRSRFDSYKHAGRK